MPKKQNIKTASNLDHWRCDCGCGQVYVYLLDEKERPFARFSLTEDMWIPHAEECVRICQGFEPSGPPARVLQVNLTASPQAVRRLTATELGRLYHAYEAR